MSWIGGRPSKSIMVNHESGDAMGTLILIVVLVLLFGGGGGYYLKRRGR